MKKIMVAIVAVICIMWFGMSGCVTQSSVKKQIDEAMDTRVGEVQEQVDTNQKEIAILKQETTEQNEQALTLGSDAFEMGEEALARAEKAGKVADGKLIYQVTFTDEAVHFGFDKSHLAKEAREALDNFSEGIKAADKNIYIEIQGHTDSIGTEAYNLNLGQARGTAVMRYLHTKHDIPLHRMNTFSYGESKPVADNKVRSNRAKNRRVTLVVIQ